VCRQATGVCDFAEYCDGTHVACPPDAFVAGETCRAAAGICDAAEYCSGSTAACPVDAKGTGVCRPSAGACDVAERCDGASDSCPVDAKSAAICRPAGGICDLAEACDGVSNACPADRKSAAICRPAVGECDIAETCDGIGDQCPGDLVVPQGTACSSDSNQCTTDQCDRAGRCEHVADSSVCDDFNPCTVDTCDRVSGCTNAARPMTGCGESTRAKVILIAGATPEFSTLKWKLSRTGAIAQTDLGTPDTDTTYALCIYDDGQSDNPVLSSSVVIEPSSLFWRSASPQGWSYSDASGSSSGVKRLTITTGEPGRAIMSLMAGGVNLPVSHPFQSDRLFEQSPNVVMQLVNDGGKCWEAVFSPQATSANTGSVFRAHFRF
jgi:hypothetical protein